MSRNVRPPRSLWPRTRLNATTPSLTSVSPSSGPATGGTTITITGTNLAGGTLNGGQICATTPVFTDTTITCDTFAFVAGATWAFNVSTPGGQTSSLSYLFLGTASVVPNPKSTVYTGPENITFSIVGLPPGAVVTKQPTCVAAGSAPHDVGSYVITCSGGEATGAFLDHSATALLTVARRPIVITPSGTQTYGGTSIRDDWSLEVNEKERQRIVEAHIDLFVSMGATART